MPDVVIDTDSRLAETAAPHLTGPGQGSWLARLDADQANLRRAGRDSLNQVRAHLGREQLDRAYARGMARIVLAYGPARRG